MNEVQSKPGDVVVTDMGVYQHWSLVTDAIGADGRFTLISATQRTGTVAEECWETVTQGKRTYVAHVDRSVSVQDMLRNARSMVGKWRYSVVGSNCEHFVKWAAGIQVSSTQLASGLGGAVLGATAVGTMAEHPTVAKYLSAAALLAAVGVFLAKAVEQVNS